MKMILIATICLGLAACQSLTPTDEAAINNAAIVGCQLAFSKDPTKVANCIAAVTAGIPLAQAIASSLPAPTK